VTLPLLARCWEERQHYQAFILTDLDSTRAVFAALREDEAEEDAGGWLIYEQSDTDHLDVHLVEASGEIKLTFHFRREE